MARAKMKNNECRLESQVLAGLREGELSAGLMAHVKQCPLCAETMRLHLWMTEFKEANPIDIEFRLPSSGEIWEKAFKQGVSRHSKELEKKAMLPIMIFQAFAVLVAVAVVALFMIPNLGTIGNYFHSWFGAGSIGEGIVTIVRSVARSFSYLLVPLGIGVSSLLISGIALALPARKDFNR